MSKYKIKNIKNWGLACPTQYFGEIEGGKAFYIRYRWGWFTFSVTIEPTDVDSYINNNIPDKDVLEVQYGDEYDGFMDYDEVIEILKSYPNLFDIEDIENL